MRNILIGLVIVGSLSPLIYAQVKNDYEAKSLLAQKGVSPLEIIDKAEFIIIKQGQIRPYGGNPNSPIMVQIQPKQVVCLPGTGDYVTPNRTVFIEGDNFGIYLSGVVVGSGMQRGFIVGRSLTDIVNFLLRK